MLTVAYVANGKSGGIASFLLEPNGKLTPRGAYLADMGVSPLAVSPNRRFLYAAVRSGPAGPAVAALLIDASSGELHPLNMVGIPDTANYLTVDASGRFLLAASYRGNFVMVLPLGREGLVQPEPVCLLRPGRNPHCVLLDAANRYAYVPVLGSDQIAQYRFDPNNGGLTPCTPAFVATDREAGPRHLAISPDNRFVHVLTEMGGEILTFAIDPANGILTPMHSVPILPGERALPKGSYTPPVNGTGGANSPQPVMWTAEIRITPDNRFLYASERTNSTLSSFRIDPVSARLDWLGVTETEERPRGFCLDPFGRHLLAAGEKSAHVSVYAIDPKTGALGRTDRKGVGEEPTWVETVILG